MSKKKGTAGDAEKVSEFEDYVLRKDYFLGEKGELLHDMRCIAAQVAFFKDWKEDTNPRNYSAFRELEDMGHHIWEHHENGGTPPAREAKARKSYSLEEVEAIVSGKSKTSPQTLGPFPFEVWKFLRTLEGVEKGLALFKSIQTKAKKKWTDADLTAELLVRELKEVGNEAARLLLPEREPFVFYTKTFQYATTCLETCRLLWRLDELPAPKETGVIRMAKGLNEQQLIRQNKPWTLFDEVEKEWENALRDPKAIIQQGGRVCGVDIGDNAGIRLDAEENALVDTLSVLLHEQSLDTEARDSENYYSPRYQTANGRAALRFTITGLAQFFTGGQKPSQKEIDKVKELLTSLSEKRFLMEMSRSVTIKGKAKKQTEFAYAPLFEVRWGSITSGKNTVDYHAIVPHEIFMADIASRYIELPEDIRGRMRQAFGKASYTDYQLRAYLLNEVSSQRKNGIAEISRERAYERFIKPDTKPYRKKELLDKALEGCKRLGLLIGYEETTGKAGQLKLILNTDLDWSRKPMPMLESGK